MPFIQRPEVNSIYYDYLDKNICNEALKYVEEIKTKIKSNPYPCKCFTSDSISHNIINDIRLQPLHLNILAHVQKYMYSTNVFYEGFIEKSWINIYEKEFFQEFHVHHDPMFRAICGIVYLSETPAETEFYMHDRIIVNPEFGKIVLFPDIVEHRVNINESEETRITLAFNYRKCALWNGVRNIPQQ